MATLTRAVCRVLCLAGYAAFPDLFSYRVEGPTSQGSAERGRRPGDLP